MTWDEHFASIVAARSGRDDFVYLERSGDSYAWLWTMPSHHH